MPITIAITGNGVWSVISIPLLVEQAGGVFFGGAIEHGRHSIAAIVAYAVLIFLTTTILRRRVKAVEIVT